MIKKYLNYLNIRINLAQRGLLYKLNNGINNLIIY
jgi:hypothetical protein